MTDEQRSEPSDARKILRAIVKSADEAGTWADQEARTAWCDRNAAAFAAARAYLAAPAQAEPREPHDIDAMVDRFLAWSLPKDFAPDCGISFDGRKDDEWNKNKSWPVGTNLFTADQARALFQHALGAARAYLAAPAQAEPRDDHSLDYIADEYEPRMELDGAAPSRGRARVEDVESGIPAGEAAANAATASPTAGRILPSSAPTAQAQAEAQHGPCNPVCAFYATRSCACAHAEDDPRTAPAAQDGRDLDALIEYLRYQAQHGYLAVAELNRWRNAIAALRARAERAEVDYAELRELHSKMELLLTRVANAIKGEPEPLHLHSWHDLPELAAALYSKLQLLEQAYANKHSPQHRASCLTEARCVLDRARPRAAIDRARTQGGDDASGDA